MLSDKSALEAVQKEAGGLISSGTWDLESVQSKASVIARAKASGTTIHFGQLMTICSEKHSELPADDPLRKMKGRVVYRGDITRDQSGALASYF